MSEQTDEARRGPLDPRIVGLSPSLRVHLVACGVLAAALAVGVLLQAEAISRLLPELIDGDRGAVGPLVAWLAIVAVVRGGVAALTERSATRALVATRRAVRTGILDRSARLRPDQRSALGPAQVASLTGTAIDALEPWVRSYLPQLLIAVVVPIAAGLRIAGTDLLSAVILAIVVPLIPIFMVIIGRATEQRAAKQWDALQRLAGRFLDVITGLPTLRLFGRAEAQVERVRLVTERYRAATMRTLRVAFLSALVLELLAALSVALVAVSLGIRLTNGSVTLQSALLVLLLAPECLLPIRRVGASFHAAAAGTDAAAEITEALALPVVPSGTTPAPSTGPLLATDVAVTDPSRGTRLRPTSARVDPGELVVIVAPSGAGKTTLLDVLRGTLTPDAGTVVLGEVPVTDLALEERATAIRSVAQHPQPIGATVAGSVALGHEAGPERDRAVAAALEQVDIADLADADPTSVSGGERRRVAVARALVAVHLGTARILLLDEPTAQLDPIAAARVGEALRWAADRGVGVAAATHDPDLVALADRTIALATDAAVRDTIEVPPAPAPGPIAAERFAARPLPVGRHDPEAPLPDRFIVDDHQLEIEAAPVLQRGAVRWLLGLARPQRGRLVGAQLLGIATEICTVGLAATAAWLIVRASERPDFADLAVAAVAVRTFALGKGVLRYTERLASHDATLRLLADLRATVVERLTHLSPTGLPDGGRGQLLTRLIDDVDRLQDLFLRVLGPLVSTLAVAIGAAVLAAAIDPGAGLALLASVAVAGLVLPAVAHRATRGVGARLAAARGEVASTIVDLAEHVDELVACGAESTWRTRIEEQSARADSLDRKQAGTAAAVAGAAAALAPLACAAVVAAVGTVVGTGTIGGPAIGVLVLLPLAVLELLTPLTAAGTVLARVTASAARVRAILQLPDPVAEPAVPAAAPTTADLAIDAASVGWPHRPPTVTGIDLTVHPGERALITGPSGAGKSTIAATLVSFLVPSAGAYRVGGVRSDALGGEQVRRCVTWCQQEPWFADSTLGDNLRIARPDATDEAVLAALDVVHLGAWVASLPEGLATQLERDAGTMSGGERQRLALARALLGGHGAIVLDEPIAHLDGPTATAVLDDLLAATVDKAVVVIGHVADPVRFAARYRLEPAGSGARWVDDLLTDRRD